MIKGLDHCAGSYWESCDKSWHDQLGAQQHLHNYCNDYCNVVCTVFYDIGSMIEIKYCHNVISVFKELFGQLGKWGSIQF